ncbi:MAG: hypothetical protein RR415_05770 [Ruthenibacterium sp.]
MATFKETPCAFYEAEGICKKGRNAVYRGYCQTCATYRPRAKTPHKNVKKVKLARIYRKEKEQ